jgi:hypothetical protein
MNAVVSFVLVSLVRDSLEDVESDVAESLRQLVSLSRGERDIYENLKIDETTALLRWHNEFGASSNSSETFASLIDDLNQLEEKVFVNAVLVGKFDQQFRVSILVARAHC